MSFLRSFVVIVSTLAVVMSVLVRQPIAQTRPGEVTASPPQTGPRTPSRDGAGNTEPAGTAVIRGFIVALETGAPLRRAQVRAFASGLRDSRIAVTDAQGRFEFKDLPEGRYNISATKGGYVSLTYGQRRPQQAGTPLELHDKQIMEKVIIGLPRGSVISGRITDEFGEPVPQVNVMPMQSRVMAGVRRVVPSGQSDRTDDQGHYRLYGLSPGEYVISATYQAFGGGGPFERTESSQEPNGFAPTYFPGVQSVGDAQRITVSVGEENSSASFALVATRLATVEGTVTGVPNTPNTAAMVTLTPSDDNGVGAMMFGPGGSGRVEANGRFRINNVAPGRYLVQARMGVGGPGGGFAMVNDNQPLFGRTQIVVSGEKVENVTIALAPGGRMRGRIMLEGDAPPSFKPEEVNVFAGPLPGVMTFAPSSSAKVKPDWSFEITGLVDPRMIRAGVGQGWMAKSVLVNGRDFIDLPVEVEPGETVDDVVIVLTNKGATVNGTVVDGRGQIVLDTSIIVFPDNPQMWKAGSRYIRSARPDQEGRYRVDMLPPFDEYLVVAVQDIEPGQTSDPAYLATVRNDATKFSVKGGEARTIDLKLRP